MGFRNFRDFNLALLGKQGWRLMARPNRLASRVFKALYFLDCEFLESKLGNNPSYVWRSIWEAKMVIKAGVRWKVGNGNKVKILNQPWLNDVVNAYVTTEVQSLEQATVAQLLSADGDQCDNEIIEDLFNLRDQQCILNTMVGENSDEDVLYWNEDLSGSIRSRVHIKCSNAKKDYGVQQIIAVCGNQFGE